ncbi:MAG: CopD family protein, partial [Aestuariivirgaceae bacterium]
MGTGMSFSNLVNVRLSFDEQGERFKALARQRRVIAQIGDGVIVLIWVTGIALMFAADAPRALAANGWFQAKFAFVVLLTLNHFMARRTAGVLARSGNAALLPKLQMFVGGVWLSAIVAICLAVLAFGR